MKNCCKYNAGMLREPVRFERLTRTSDNFGGATEAWAAISGAPTLAHVRNMSGREIYVSERLEARANLKIVVRYFAGLTEVDRVQVGGRPCQIRRVNNVDFEDRWLEIDAEIGAAT